MALGGGGFFGGGGDGGGGSWYQPQGPFGPRGAFGMWPSCGCGSLFIILGGLLIAFGGCVNMFMR
jgi:hypothetical protein